MGQALNWQLKFGTNTFRGGHVVRVLKYDWEDPHAVFALYDADSRTLVRFFVDCSVDIGGQAYIFIRPELSPNDAQTVARLLDKYRVCAMDAERFSSLHNALDMFLESNPVMTKDDLDKLMR
ncbi:MAG TPA: hypothetical protein V6C81_04485 [Planktothrix sp.]